MQTGFLPVCALAIISVNAQTFTNPVFLSQDPWVVFADGNYYYSESAGQSIYVRKSPTLLGLAAATPVKVWTAPAAGPNSREVWAPELHQIGSQRYIYYAADDGNNNNHRLFALTAAGPDPQGAYTMALTGDPNGRILESSGHWGIDPNVFTAADGRLYLVWSCTASATSAFPQSTCLARMSDALHVVGSTVQISTPTQPWETRTAAIQEGPVGFVHNGVNYITYSASASWTTDYSVGLLANASTNLLDPASWIKSGPILDHHNIAYGPGSVVFAPSPDGTEMWNVYHGIDRANCTPNAYSCRDIRMQPMWWAADGSPLLGYPVDPGVPLPAPSTGGTVDHTARNWGDAFGDAAEGSAAGNQTGAWTITGPASAASASLGAGWHQIFHGSSPNYENYVVQADMQWLSSGFSSSTPRYGIYAAYIDARNYLTVWLDPFARKLYSYGVVNNRVQNWQSARLRGGFDPAQYHTLTVQKTGLSTFAFAVDGVTVGKRSVNLLNGQLGLVTEDTTANYRNVSIRYPREAAISGPARSALP